MDTETYRDRESREEGGWGGGANAERERERERERETDTGLFAKGHRPIHKTKRGLGGQGKWNIHHLFNVQHNLQFMQRFTVKPNDLDAFSRLVI